MEPLFWIAAFVIVYVYVGYPALLLGWARVASQPVRSAPIELPVSIIVAVRNEAARLADRLNNLLALDYAAERLQIIVVSDGSTDATVELLARYAGRVDVVLLPPGGKPRALNAGVQAAKHDILVFTDARQTFAPDALHALVAPFADSSVGGVSGELVLDCETGAASSTIGEGIGLYWRYEKLLRRLESEVRSQLGATGAIYALRRSLWRPLPPDTILDDVLAPMRAALAGARVVFESRARAFDRTASHAAAESRRKIRTLAGNYQILWLEPRLLLPLVNPVWLQYVSHKIGRLLVPYALTGLFVSSAALAGTGIVYATAFAGQVIFYALAAYGSVLDQRERTGLESARVPRDTESDVPIGKGSGTWAA